MSRLNYYFFLYRLEEFTIRIYIDEEGKETQSWTYSEQNIEDHETKEERGSINYEKYKEHLFSFVC